MFKSIKEFVEALLEGREFTFRKEYKNHNRYGQVFFFKEGFRWEDRDNYTKGTMDEIDFNSFDKIEEYIKPQWYRNIPKQGILCWVKDFPSEEPKLMLVLSYRYDKQYSYITECTAYIHATPATSEEVKQFIHQP